MEGVQALNFDTLGFIKPFDSKPPAYSSVARDINRELYGEELMNIHVGPKMIDFGKVFINSHSKKYFYIKNNLKGAVNSKFVFDEEALQTSENGHQIVPSGSTACFPISFKAIKLGTYSQILRYRLNDKHSFKVLIRAVVEKVRVNMSAPKVDLNFDHDEHSLSTAKSITITNPGNSDAIFKWVWDSPSFTLAPDRGIVEPGNTEVIEIIYKPETKRTFENDFARLEIENGVE